MNGTSWRANEHENNVEKENDDRVTCNNNTITITTTKKSYLDLLFVKPL